MDDQQLYELIRKLLKEGKSLPEIHTHITKELGQEITFLDLRLLIADLDVELPEEEEDETPEPPPPPQRDVNVALPPGAQSAPDRPAAGTSVSVDAVTRPGVALSGKFTTRSGASGAWYMDPYGRVALDAGEGAARPGKEDMAELQEELTKVLRRQSGAL